MNAHAAPPVPALTPLALENAELLVRLEAQDFKSKTELAAQLGRDQPNLNKTLKRLAGEHLVAGEGLTTLTPAGANAVRVIRQLRGGEISAPAGAPVGGGLLHRQIHADPNNPRKDFTSPEAQDAMGELKASILLDGLIEPIVVRPYQVVDGEQHYMIVAGERRWTALRLAIDAGEWPADRPVPASIMDVDEPTARRLALVENLQRRDLKPLEEARALQALAELTGASAAQLGRDLGFTERWAQQRLALLKLPETLTAKLDAGELTVEEARLVPSLLEKLPPLKRADVEAGFTRPSEAKAWLEAQPKPLGLDPDVWLVALELYDAIQRRPLKHASWEYEKTEVGRAAEGDEGLTRLRMHNLYSGPSDYCEKNQRTGRLQVSLTYDVRNQLDRKYGPDYRGNPDRLQELLSEARAGLGLDGDYPAGVYVTAWLNPPFEVPAEIAAKIAEERASAEASEARERERQKADRDAAAEKERKVKAALEVNREIAKSILTDPEGPAKAIGALAELHPLPWRYEVEDEWSEGLVDAKGETIDLEPYNDQQCATLMLVLGIVNSFAGHPTEFIVKTEESADEEGDETDAGESEDAG